MLEYETAAMAEEAQQQADGLALGGSNLRVSFCAPGPPGRSMLAALIAAQATVSVHPEECPGGWGSQGPDSHPSKHQGPWWASVGRRDEAPSLLGGGGEALSCPSPLLRPRTEAEVSCWG